MQRVLPAALLYLALLALFAIGGWQVGQTYGGPARPAPRVAAAPLPPEAAAPAPARPAPVPAQANPSPAAVAPAAPPLPKPAPPKPLLAVRREVSVPTPPAPLPPSPPQPAPQPQVAQTAPTPTPAPPEAPPPAPTPTSALKSGVLIVISLPSQRAYVFKDGELWDSSRVSTGKPGKRTPAGTFTILQKQVHHRSTKYDDAPMPYMQRITWGGVALHAGHVPGYPASHGCIRLPAGFAKRLYRITDFDSTVVVVTNKRVHSSEEARDLS